MQETLQKNATDKNRRETKVSLQEMKIEVLSLLNKKLILSKKGKKTRFPLCIYLHIYPHAHIYKHISTGAPNAKQGWRYGQKKP